MRAGFCCAIGEEEGRGGTGYAKSEPAQGAREGASGSVAFGESAGAGRGPYANPRARARGGRGSDANVRTAVSQLPPPTCRPASPWPRPSSKRRRACAVRRNEDLVCYTTAVEPGAALSVASRLRASPVARLGSPLLSSPLLLLSSVRPPAPSGMSGDQLHNDSQVSTLSSPAGARSPGDPGCSPPRPRGP